MNSAKCPSCNKIVTTLKIVTLPAITSVGGDQWKGAAFICPHSGCGAILGTQIDPIALKAGVEAHTSNCLALFQSKLLQELQNFEQNLTTRLEKLRR